MPVTADSAFSNGTHEARGYDSRMQLASLALDGGGDPLQSLSYQRDRAGNLTSVDDPAGNLSAQYQYDAWYRLVGAQLGARASSRFRAEESRALLALIVLAVGLRMGLGLFFAPDEPFVLMPGMGG